MLHRKLKGASIFHENSWAVNEVSEDEELDQKAYSNLSNFYYTGLLTVCCHKN